MHNHEKIIEFLEKPVKSTSQWEALGFLKEKREIRQIYINRNLNLCIKEDFEKKQNPREWSLYNLIPEGSPYKEYFPRQYYLSKDSTYLLCEFINHRVNHESIWEKLKKETKENGFFNYCQYLIGMDSYELRKFDSWRFNVVEGKQKFKLVDFGN